MTAPDAQPPAVPEIWWSPSRQAEKGARSVAPAIMWSHRSGVGFVTPPDLPADAVRLVPASWSGLLSILDEHYPADVFVGGEGSDPGPRIVALSREVARLRASAALAGTTTPTDEPLRYAAAVVLEQTLRSVLDKNADDDATALAEKLVHAVLNAEWRPVRASTPTSTEETD